MIKTKILKNEAFTPIGGVGTGLHGNFGYGKKQLVLPPNNPPKDFQHIVDDMVQDQIDLIMNGTEEPIWTSENKSNLSERDLGDAASGNPLPGGPPPNTLVQKKYFVPVDTAEENNVDFLGPTVGGIPLNDIEGNISKNRKVAVPRRMEKQTIDMNALVSQQQLVPDPEEVRIDTPGENPNGGMGTLVKGVQHVPVGKGINANAKDLENEQKKDFRNKVVITPMKHNSNSLQEMIELLVEQEIELSEEKYKQGAFGPIPPQILAKIEQIGASGQTREQIEKRINAILRVVMKPTTIPPGPGSKFLANKERERINAPLRPTPPPEQPVPVSADDWKKNLLNGMNISSNRASPAWQAHGIHTENKKKK